MVAELRAREPVGDVYRRLSLHKLREVLVDLRLGQCVERGGRLIHDDHVRVLIQCAGDRKLLRFAAGKLRPILLYDLEKRLIQPFSERAHLFAKADTHKRIHRAGAVAIRAAGDVFKHRICQHVHILKHHGEHRIQSLFFKLPDRDAVDGDLPLRRFQQAGHELHERGFARAVHADDCKALALMDREIEVPEDVFFRARVAEADVFEFDLERIARDGRAHPAPLAQILVHHAEKVIHVFAFAVDLAQHFREALEQRRKAQRRSKVHGKVRDGHPMNHVADQDAISCRIAQKERCERRKAQQELPAGDAGEDGRICVDLPPEVVEDAGFEAVKPHVLAEGKIVRSVGIIPHAALRMADLRMEAVAERMRSSADPIYRRDMQQQRREDPHAFEADEHDIGQHRQEHGRAFKQHMIYALYAFPVAVCRVHSALVFIIKLRVLGAAIAHGEDLVHHILEVFQPEQR